MLLLVASELYAFASSFLGVAFLAGAFFVFAAAVFLVAAFFAPAVGAVLLVTRPDLVFPRTTAGLSSTAGAGAAFLARAAPALAFGFVAFLAVVVLALVAVFLGLAAVVFCGQG